MYSWFVGSVYVAGSFSASCKGLAAYVCGIGKNEGEHGVRAYRITVPPGARVEVLRPPAPRVRWGMPLLLASALVAAFLVWEHLGPVL